jgi:outer membrane protein assembly factor BamB
VSPRLPIVVSKIATLLACLAAVGCMRPPAPEAGGDIALDRVLHLLWRRDVAASLTTPFTSAERSAPALDPEGDRVFVGSSDQHLYALRAGDGSTLWRFRTHGAVGCEITFDASTDTVFFGTDDGYVYAVDAGDGSQKWRTPARGEVRRRPVLGPEAVYVATGNDVVLALDRDTGRRLWMYKREPPDGFAVEGHAGVASSGRRIFAGFSDGTVVALDAAEGSALWERETAQDVELPEEDSSLPTYLDVDTTPIVHDGLVYAASHAAGVYALDERGGGVQWRREDMGGTTGLALSGGELYASRARVLDVVSASSGEARYRVDLPAQSLTSPTVTRGVVLVAGTRGALYAISREQQAVVTLVSAGEGFGAAPVAAGRRAFALSNAGVLYSLEVD